jgi:hypothetical protein
VSGDGSCSAVAYFGDFAASPNEWAVCGQIVPGCGGGDEAVFPVANVFHTRDGLRSAADLVAVNLAVVPPDGIRAEERLISNLLIR